MTRLGRFGVHLDGRDGIRPDSRTCNFGASYPVMTENGVMHLCAGCAADLRLRGEKATFVRGKVAA